MKLKSCLDIRIILFAAVVLVSATLLKPLRDGLLTRMEGLRDTGIERLETILGKTVSYDSMRPSIFGTMDFSGIRINGDDGDFKSITVKRLRLRYSLAALFTKRPLDALKEVKIEDPLVEAGAGQDFDTLFKGENGGGLKNMLETIKTGAGIVPKNVILRVSGGALRFTAGESVVKTSGIAFTARTLNDTLQFRLSTRFEALIARPRRLSAAFLGQISGVYNIKTGESGIKIGIDSAETSYFSLNKLNFLVSLSDNTVTFQKIGDMEPFDVSVNYDLSASAFNMRARFAGFRASRLLRFSPELNSWNDWTGTRLYGDVNVSFDGAAGLAYRAALRGDLDKSAPVGAGSFELSAEGGEKNVFFNKLSVSLPRGELVWTGSLNFAPLMPKGSLLVRDFNLTKSGRKDQSSPLNGSFIVSSYGNTVTFFAETLFVGTPGDENSVELLAFDVTVTRADGEFNFSVNTFRVKNVESYDEAVFSPVSADGSFDFEDKNLEIRLESEAFSLYDILKITGAAVELPVLSAQARLFLDNILITSEIFVSTNFKDLLYNVPHLIIAWRGESNVWASFSIAGTENNFDLSESHIVLNGGGIDIAARGDFTDKNDMLFGAELRTEDRSYTFNAAVLDKSNISVSSSLGLAMNISRSPSGSLSGLLMLDAPRFPLGNGFAEISAEADFRYDSPKLWDLNIRKFRVSGIRGLMSSTAAAELIGQVNQDGAEFSRIYFDDGRGALYGNASGRWEGLFSGEEISITGDIDLRDTDGIETLNAELRYAEDSVFVWAEVTELQSGRFFAGTDNMFINGDVGFFKTMENWSAAFALSSLRGVFNGRPVTLSGRASLDENRLDISETQVSYSGVFADIPFLSIDLPRSNLNSSARLWGSALDNEFTTDLSVNMDFAAIDSWFNIKKALNSFDGVMNFENTRFSNVQSMEKFNFKFSRNGQILNIEGGPDDMIRLHTSDSGDFFAAFSYPSPVLGTVVGFIKDGIIDAEASGLYIDVASLWRYIPMDKLLISGGFVIADVRILGPLHDPEFFGTAMANSLVLGIPDFLDEDIGPTPAFLTFNGSEIRLEPLSVWIGKGSGSLSGSLRVSRWRPSSFEASLNVNQAHPIPLNMNIAGFLVKGTVFGLLNLSSDGQILNISGDVSGDDTEISLITEDSAGRNGETKSRIPMQTDIRITAGRKVEFLWPNADIPILQAYAASGSAIRLISDSLSGHFSINGDIDIRGGELFYFQRSFYIKEGSMSFNESEIQFDPRFSAVAETRDRTNNETVTISLIIDNQPLRSFTPRFESNPPLSQIEIFTLLGDKLSGSPTGENAINRAFISSTADVLAQFGVVRQVEKTIRDFLHIDMFSLRTQALQNAILFNVFRDTGESRSGSELQGQAASPQNEIRIGNYFDNTTVFLGKYIGADLFIQAMLSFRYDPLRPDMWGLWLEPDLSMEFKGPLFDIRWDFVPTHPENLWVSDVKITLSKKWTLP
ncbi:MAG: translocation/assembly module TamB [Spirochaetaceae bacterium]|jgi:hypothetical protein|nr:translocation/assembly module TamB [Spirochaetaceae bacterium]